jgi:nucleotide-binding universal stress UspA family protein
MQPIVVAIDFSNTSVHALEYAITLANKMHTDIHMVWVDKISVQESVYSENPMEQRMEVKKRFEELAGSMKQRLAKGLSLDFKMRKGKIYREVDQYAQSVNAGLIVTGAHGISGFEEYWIGSNAYKIVSFTAIPVITVKQDYPIQSDIRKILVLMDGSNETIQKVPFSVRLAEIFSAEIILLTTHNNNLKSIQRIAEKYTLLAADYIRAHKVGLTEESLVSNNLTKAALNFAIESGVDIISIMTEQETPVNVHMGAQAQQLITQSPIPVLSIRPVEKFNLL